MDDAKLSRRRSKSPVTGSPTKPGTSPKGGASPGSRAEANKRQMMSEKDVEFLVSLKAMPPSDSLVRGRFPRETQVFPCVGSVALHTDSPSLAHFLEPRGACDGGPWWKPPVRGPSGRSSAEPCPPAGHSLGHSAPSTSQAPSAALAVADDAVPVSLSWAMPESGRSAALAAACAAHGARLVTAMQDPVNSVLVAVNGEKNPRVPLFELARVGVDECLLQNKAASRVPLKVSPTHGKGGLFPAVAIVEVGRPADGEPK